ncbi:MAG: response regulator [Candidatus Rokubacteria bacterium]|nr:response regulator [Candidatus Rokubacteria bacterium]
MPTTKSPRLLLIEDHAPLGRALGDALGASGYLVEIAIDGENGIDLFRTRRPDLVILDLLLPRVPGTAVLAELRRIDPSVPVLVLSGADRSPVTDSLVERGAFAYLRKPVPLGELRRHILAALAR